jgi:hypothetical protein
VQEVSVGVSTYAFSLVVTAVPEPSAALFMMGGLAALAAARTRR